MIFGAADLRAVALARGAEIKKRSGEPERLQKVTSD